MEMWIDIRIPYGPNHQLAKAYNKAMSESVSEWVILLDHDVYLALNPHWYEMCVNAAKTVSEDVGMITCVTYNRNGFDLVVDKTDDISIQQQYAYQLFQKYGDELEEANTHKLAGFFMLVRKSTWENIKFEDQGKGVNKIDHNWCKRVMDSGQKIMLMKGLYIFHKRGVRKLSWGRQI